jgi:copper chaperone NosL
MGDFYKWEYDYGHNLDLEHAPIKIPGMAYQPPLIGSKKLLNFTATSWPAAGGMLAIAAVLLAGASAVLVLRTPPFGARDGSATEQT